MPELKPYDAIYRTPKGELTQDADKGSFIGTVTKIENGLITISTKYGVMVSDTAKVEVKPLKKRSKQYVNVFEHRR